MKIKFFIIFILLTSFLAPVSLASESDTARITMLEKALAPQTPKAVAQLFAIANQTRNGAIQYMLFSNSLKKAFKDNWPNWVSGTSSPWITGWKIKTIRKDKKETVFEIQYEWATAAGPFKPDLIQQIVVQQASDESTQKFWVTDFKEIESK